MTPVCFCLCPACRSETCQKHRVFSTIREKCGFISSTAKNMKNRTALWDSDGLFLHTEAACWGHRPSDSSKSFFIILPLNRRSVSHNALPADAPAFSCSWRKEQKESVSLVSFLAAKLAHYIGGLSSVVSFFLQLWSKIHPSGELSLCLWTHFTLLSFFFTLLKWHGWIYWTNMEELVLIPNQTICTEIHSRKNFDLSLIHFSADDKIKCFAKFQTWIFAWDPKNVLNFIFNITFCCLIE